MDLYHARYSTQPGSHRLSIKLRRVLGTADNGAFGTAATEK